MVLKKEYNPKIFIPNRYNNYYSIFTPDNGMVNYPSTFYLAKVLRISEVEVRKILLEEFNGVKDGLGDIEFETLRDCEAACAWLNDVLVMVNLIENSPENNL